MNDNAADDIPEDLAHSDAPISVTLSLRDAAALQLGNMPVSELIKSLMAGNYDDRVRRAPGEPDTDYLATLFSPIFGGGTVSIFASPLDALLAYRCITAAGHRALRVNDHFPYPEAVPKFLVVHTVPYGSAWTGFASPA